MSLYAQHQVKLKCQRDPSHHIFRAIKGSLTSSPWKLERSSKGDVVLEHGNGDDTDKPKSLSRKRKFVHSF
jgi:hypothetical protein